MAADSEWVEEVRVHNVMKHPNVCALLGFVVSEDLLLVALEFCSGGDLFDLIREREDTHFSWLEVQTYMAELLVATDYVHGCGVTHRGIKPENILLQEKFGQALWCVKLADFGLAGCCPTGGGS